MNLGLDHLIYWIGPWIGRLIYWIKRSIKRIDKSIKRIDKSIKQIGCFSIHLSIHPSIHHLSIYRKIPFKRYFGAFKYLAVICLVCFAFISITCFRGQVKSSQGQVNWSFAYCIYVHALTFTWFQSFIHVHHCHSLTH